MVLTLGRDALTLLLMISMLHDCAAAGGIVGAAVGAKLASWLGLG